MECIDQALASLQDVLVCRKRHVYSAKMPRSACYLGSLSMASLHSTRQILVDEKYDYKCSSIRRSSPLHGPPAELSERLLPASNVRDAIIIPNYSTNISFIGQGEDISGEAPCCC